MPLERICRVCGSDDVYIYDRDGGWCETHYREAEASRHAEEKRATEEAGGPWPQTCPRRLSDWGPWDRAENLDSWDIREQMAHGLRARHCSFCGSLHPDDFMRLIKEGWEVGATDKNYKAYLGTAKEPQQTKFYFQHLSTEQKREFVELYNQHTIRFEGAEGFYRFPFFMAPA